MSSALRKAFSCVLLVAASIAPVRSQCTDIRQALDEYRKARAQRSQSAMRKSALLCYQGWMNCYTAKNPTIASEDFVQCNYNLGFYSLQLQRYDQARTYFQNCVVSPTARTMPFDGKRTFYDLASKLTTTLGPNGSRREQSSLTLSFRGKSDFMFDVGRTVPPAAEYSSEQIDTLVGRLVSTTDAQTFPAVARTIAPFEYVEMHGAFAICIVKDKASFGSEVRAAAENTSLSTPRPEVDMDDVHFPQRESTLSLVKLVKATIAQTQRDFENTFGTTIERADVVPLYIVNSEYSPAGFRFFSAVGQHISRVPVGQKFGYFNEYDNSILFWYQSGIGTLAHELVHQMISVDNPGIPQWLNEGIASIAECGSLKSPRDNWRLVYLQSDKNLYGSYLPLAEVLSTSAPKPRHPLVRSSYYRYFMMYLKEKGLLKQVYAQYRNTDTTTVLNAPADEVPVETQLQSIAKILGKENPEIVQTDFWNWLTKRGLGKNNSYDNQKYKQLVWTALTERR